MTESRAVPVPATPSAVDAVGRLAALDQAAWQQLYEQYFHKMRDFAYLRTGDLALAEDIASDVFAAAVKGIGRYRDTGAPIGAWLYRIARNLTADQVDRRRRRPQQPLDFVEVESPSATQPVEDHSDLLRGLHRLTREQQEVISLRFYAACSVQETADAMGKSVGAVKLLQHRALAALRVQLSEGRP